MEKGYVVALDQGTTSSRSIVYDCSGNELASSSCALPIRYPEDGWVEQEPSEIWQTQLQTLKEATKEINPADIRCIGITNQRETVIAWDPLSGEALAPAIVWQCRRSSDICKVWRDAGRESLVRAKTGLVLDPYFSGTKIVWMLENVAGLKERVQKGTVVFGTVDSWLLFNLTRAGDGKAQLATEPSNASRTLLYSLDAGDWDDELLTLVGITRKNLPQIETSDARFAETTILGASIPVTGILGDQQASLFGHGCTTPGSAKCTFGTGAFLLVNQGSKRKDSDAGLLTTAAWTRRSESPQYAIEGSVFIAGALIQWLRDNLGIVASSAETETIAASVEDSAGVVIVPAFVGLGSPHWDDSARGSIMGLSRDSSAGHIVRASLEAVAHQVADILEGDAFQRTTSLNIDGGMSRNKLFNQILADITERTIVPSASAEVTAFGAASIAALGVGLYPDLKALQTGFVLGSDGSGVDEIAYEPAQSASSRADRTRWKVAVERSKGWITAVT